MEGKWGDVAEERETQKNNGQHRGRAHQQEKSYFQKERFPDNRNKSRSEVEVEIHFFKDIQSEDRWSHDGFDEVQKDDQRHRHRKNYAPKNVERDPRQQTSISSNTEPTYTRHVIIEPEESDPYDSDKRRVFVADNSIKISTEAIGRPRPSRREQSLYAPPKGKYSGERESSQTDANRDNTRRHVKYQDDREAKQYDAPPRRQRQQEEEEQQNRKQTEQGRRTYSEKTNHYSNNNRRNTSEEGHQYKYQHQEEEDYREKSSRHPSKKPTEEKQRTFQRKNTQVEEKQQQPKPNKHSNSEEQTKEEDKTTRVLILDIEVEKGKIESLEVFEGNDPLKLSTDFCNKFNMDPKYVEYIADQIRTNLSKLNQST